MPTRRVKDNDRRRCARACTRCKRRKEGCDGIRPCRRCTARGLEDQCFFSDVPKIPDRRDTSAFHHEDDTPNLNILGEGHEAGAEFERSTLTRALRSQASLQRSFGSHSTPVPHTPRMIQDSGGRFMFIGDSATSSFLQDVRKVVHTSIGECSFVNDPLQHMMVEASPQGRPLWIDANLRAPPAKPRFEEAESLVRRFIWATSCVLDLFDETELLRRLSSWIEAPHVVLDANSLIYYLVLAIGLQTSEDDKDDIAEMYFSYGRYLTASNFTEDPSITTVQSYALITMYLLGASRRNTAFMHLGTAVRAAYALGLHRGDVAKLFTPAEVKTRERLWKVVRILDGFLSTSLGRPMSTTESRDTEAEANYSAALNLCTIFDTILNDVYVRRQISSEAPDRVSGLQRRWARRFREGLANDKTYPGDEIDSIYGKKPNIGLYHVKEAYYWTIILLTRYSLLEKIQDHLTAREELSGEIGSAEASSSNDVLVQACVNSAISTIELLKGLLAAQDIPKRLPFVVNSIFLSALVVGARYFADLDVTLPLARGLQTSQLLLRRFGAHDAVASRQSMIVDHLQKACDLHVVHRSHNGADRQRRLVIQLFGHIGDNGLVTGIRDATNNETTSHYQNASVVKGGLSTSHEGVATIERQRADSSNSNSRPFQAELDEGFEDGSSILLPGGSSIDTYRWVGSPKTIHFGAFDESMPFFATMGTTLVP